MAICARSLARSLAFSLSLFLASQKKPLIESFPDPSANPNAETLHSGTEEDNYRLAIRTRPSLFTGPDLFHFPPPDDTSHVLPCPEIGQTDLVATCALFCCLIAHRAVQRPIFGNRNPMATRATQMRDPRGGTWAFCASRSVQQPRSHVSSRSRDRFNGVSFTQRSDRQTECRNRCRGSDRIARLFNATKQLYSKSQEIEDGSISRDLIWHATSFEAASNERETVECPAALAACPLNYRKIPQLSRPSSCPARPHLHTLVLQTSERRVCENSHREEFLRLFQTDSIC